MILKKISIMLPAVTDFAFVGHQPPWWADLLSTRKRWWAGLDLNQRRREPANLQSAPFDHSGTYPFFACGESEKEAREHHLRKYFLLCFSIV